jgi:hypothetical protein
MTTPLLRVIGPEPDDVARDPASTSTGATGSAPDLAPAEVVEARPRPAEDRRSVSG